MKTSPNLRLTAALVIDQVTHGRSLADCLEPALSSLKDPRDRAFVQAICYGVCRFYSRLDVLLSYLIKKPLNANDTDLHALLLVGLYQLIYMRVPAHAAVAETVNATLELDKVWAKGFTNAILREFQRSKSALEEQIKSDEEGHFSHPEWLIDEISAAWPDCFQTVLNANNDHPPLSVRVNERKLSRESYLEKLIEEGYAAQLMPVTRSGIVFSAPIPIESLPGFSSGEVSVQDGAAQLAAELLDLEPGQRVLDACAAPGGKLTHILEIEPDLAAIVAVEKDPARLKPIHENLARLNLQAEVICADVADIDKWWDKNAFDRILLDAPCSASGVIRRHPDIKLLRQPDDIEAFAEEQFHLLEALWPTLKVGGILLYATCSIFPAENVAVMKRFLSIHADAEEVKIATEWVLTCEIGIQILPGMHQMDGFYYARLRKLA